MVDIDMDELRAFASAEVADVFEKLRAIAKAATQGEWEVETMPENVGGCRNIRAAATKDEWSPNGWDIVYTCGLANDDEDAANATHIATFDPPTVLALLDTIARLRAEVARLQGAPPMAADLTREQLAAEIERLDAGLRSAEAAVNNPKPGHSLFKAIAHRDHVIDDIGDVLASHLPALVQALRDAARAEALTWRPIETAPKDGTQILIARRGEDVGCQQFELTEWCVSKWPHYEHVEGDLYRQTVETREFWNNNEHRATHWMPLPEPPTALDPTP